MDRALRLRRKTVACTLLSIPPKDRSPRVMKSIALQLASLFIALASSAGMAIAATIDPTFAPNIAGLGSIVAAAEAGDGSILLAGVFDSIGNTPLNGLARIGSDGSADPNFAPQLLPVGSSVLTNGITRLSDGRILINGNFKSFGTTTANYAVILNP